MFQPQPSPPQIVYQSPAPAPKADDPAALEAARKQRVIEATASGRGSTLLAGGDQTDPTRRMGSRLLGSFGALG